MAAIAYNADLYLGFDPNKMLKEGHEQIINLYSKNKIGKSYRVLYIPFEESKLENQTFDLVFTSPPYFDLEIYSENPGQSIISYPSLSEWIVRFLFFSLEKAWRKLVFGGTMVIHLNE